MRDKYKSVAITVITVLLGIFLCSCVTVNAPPPRTTAKPLPTFTATEAPVIVSFTAEPAEIGKNELSTLKWQATGVQNITIDHGVGVASAVGDYRVEPDVTTTYTLTASNSLGTVTKSVTVSVVGNMNAQKIALTRDDVRLYQFSYVSGGSIQVEDVLTAYSVQFAKGQETLTNTVLVYSPTTGGSERKFYEVEGQYRHNMQSLYSIGEVNAYYIISRATNEDDFDRYGIRFYKNNVWVHLGFIADFQTLQTLAKMLVSRIY